MGYSTDRDVGATHHTRTSPLMHLPPPWLKRRTAARLLAAFRRENQNKPHPRDTECDVALKASATVPPCPRTSVFIHTHNPKIETKYQSAPTEKNENEMKIFTSRAEPALTWAHPSKLRACVITNTHPAGERHIAPRDRREHAPSLDGLIQGGLHVWLRIVTRPSTCERGGGRPPRARLSLVPAPAGRLQVTLLVFSYITYARSAIDRSGVGVCGGVGWCAGKGGGGDRAVVLGRWQERGGKGCVVVRARTKFVQRGLPPGEVMLVRLGGDGARRVERVADHGQRVNVRGIGSTARR